MTRDRCNGSLRPVVNTDRPILSSAAAPWRNIVKLEHHRPSTFEIPEHCPCEHFVALTLTPGIRLESRIAGEQQPDILLSSDDVAIVSRHVPIWWRWDRALEFLVVSLAPDLVAHAVEEVADAGRFGLTNAQGIRDRQIQHMMLALAAELRAGCPAGRLYGEGLATALAAHLLRRYAGAPPRLVAYRGGLPPARLRRVLDYIEAHLGGDGTGLRQLAALAQLSPHRFAALFKRSTGVPPHQYVLRRRIARARDMLADPRLPLAEIAYAVGFPSQAHFTATFRKLVGTTPGTYRRELQ